MSRLKYHLLHPEYIHGRIEKLGKAFSLRIMLVQCDVDNHAAAIKELTKICIIMDFTMVVAFSSVLSPPLPPFHLLSDSLSSLGARSDVLKECRTAEAGRYLEIYKTFEKKPPDMIKERVENDHMSHLNAALTSIKGVNKTDVLTLASNFGVRSSFFLLSFFLSSRPTS